MMTNHPNPVFHGHCLLLEFALKALPYVAFVDAMPTLSTPNETTVVLDTKDEHPLTLSHLCEILCLIREHLGEQKFFDIEVGRATVCISGIRCISKAKLGLVYVTAT
jgi:hypothetical protein